MLPQLRNLFLFIYIIKSFGTQFTAKTTFSFRTDPSNCLHLFFYK